MNNLCGCTEVSASEKNPSSCNTCSGTPVNMLGSLGLEVINPYLNWKKVPKGKSRAVRRARTSFTSIIEREPSKNVERECKDLVKVQPEMTKEMPDSESEKVGVAILGQRFGDVLESIPIKKRRFLFRSPSPPLDSDESRKDSVNNCNSVKSADRERNSNGPGKKFGDCVDFSGITMLAVAACNTETIERERPENNYESSSNLTGDSLGSLLVIPTDDGKGSLSRDDRLHWDLNTVMEAWESPCGEEKKLEDVVVERENAVDLVSASQLMESGTKGSLQVDSIIDSQCSEGGAQVRLEVKGCFESVSKEKLMVVSGIDFCEPSGEQTDQPADIKVDFDAGVKSETLDGSTGSGKSYVLASSNLTSVIQERESLERCTTENGRLDEDHQDQDQDDDSDKESCSKVEKKADQTVEDESSSQYEDGEFRESFVLSWGIDGGDDGDQEHVDYGSEDIGEAEIMESAALPLSNAPPEAGESAATAELLVEPGISSLMSADSDLVLEKKFVVRKWEEKEDGSGGTRSARVRSSGWDRLPSGETTAGSAFHRRRERPYFHGTRHVVERSMRAPQPPRRQSGFFRPDAAAASIAKVESNGFVVAPDGTILEAANPPQPTGSADRVLHRQRHRHSFSPPLRSRSPPRRWRRSPEFRVRAFVPPPPRARISHRWVEPPFTGDRSSPAEMPFSGSGDDGRYQKKLLPRRQLVGSDRRYGGGGGEEFRRSSGKDGGGDLDEELGRLRYGIRREEKFAQFKPRFGQSLRHFDEDKSRRRRHS